MTKLLPYLLWIGAAGLLLLGVSRVVLIQLTHECLCEAARDLFSAMIACGLRSLLSAREPEPEPFDTEANRLRVFQFDEDDKEG